MEIGLFAPLGNGNANGAVLRTLGREAEARGFESIWVAEHVVMFDDYESQYPYAADGRFPGGGDTGLLEPLTALAYLAAVTDRIRLGTGICLVPQRNPVYTAKQVVDVDNLSGGRVDFGIGDRVAQGGVRRPGRAVREARRAHRRVPLGDEGAVAGRGVRVPRRALRPAPCRLYPKPVQTPHPPIHVGGESDAALRRVAAHGQGWYTFNRLPDDLDEPLVRLDELLAAQGRSRADVQITVCPYLHPVTPELVAAYADRGVDRLVLLCFAFEEADDHRPRRPGRAARRRSGVAAATARVVADTLTKGVGCR